MKLTNEQLEIVKQYGHLFHNTGGNDPVELMERDGINYFNNPLVAELQGSCYSQTMLLLKLRSAGMLSPSLEQVAYMTKRGAVYCGTSRNGVTPLYRIKAWK